MTDKIPEALAVLDRAINRIEHGDGQANRELRKVRATLAHFIDLSGIINAEFRTDPMAVQCFDLRVLKQWQAALSDMENLK